VFAKSTSINTAETEDLTTDLNDLNAVMNALDWGSDDDARPFSNEDYDFNGGGSRDQPAPQAVAEGQPSLGDAGPSQGTVHVSPP
jgi:hypothetical protein